MAMTEILISGLLIIIGVVLTLAINGINRQIDALGKRVDDLKDLFRAELAPINEKLNNHITDTDKKIDALDTEIKEIRKEINEKLDKLLAQSK